MIIYIFGFMEEDSGKTTIGTYVIRYLREIGLKIAPFKPVAGFNYWRQYENFLNSIKYGTIFSFDAFRLESIAKSGEPLEVINPVSFLFTPSDIQKYIENDAISRFLFEETLVRNLVLARLTTCQEDKIENQVFLNKRRIEYLLHDARIFKIFEERNTREFDIENLEEFLEEMSLNTRQHIDSCFNRLSERYNNILIESFNNSIIPWKGILAKDIDIAIGAFPGYALFFDAKAFKDASRTLMSFRGDIITGEMLLGVLSPKKIVRIPPLTSKFGNFEEKLYRNFISSLESELKNII